MKIVVTTWITEEITTGDYTLWIKFSESEANIAVGAMSYCLDRTIRKRLKKGFHLTKSNDEYRLWTSEYKVASWLRWANTHHKVKTLTSARRIWNSLQEFGFKVLAKNKEEVEQILKELS
jgi:hypothetical protein